MSSPGLSVERVAPVFFLLLVDILGLTVILPLLHLYAAKFGATPLEIGLLVAAFPIAQLVGVPMMGTLSDRFGRKPLLLISQVTTCASFVLLGLANTLWLVILSRVIDGLFGANIATAQAALTDISSEEERAQALGLTGAAFGIGFVLGPLISAISLSFTDRLSIPAFIAAGYSLLSIILTAVMFKETLPKNARQQTERRTTPLTALRTLRDPRINLLLVMMFAQQLIFFGFESLLGLFTLSRLGMLGEGNAYIFVVVGVILVMVQGRYIGKWSRRYGDHRVAQGALALLSVGLVLLALTPQQPPLNYIQARAERALLVQQAEGEQLTSTITLPEDTERGLWGVPWLLMAIVPLSIGAGLIRPSLNTLMTKRVSPLEYGMVLGAVAFAALTNAELTPSTMP
ncbi:MAG: MFS transporter, partial [Chloroflexota bacterium]